MPRWCLSTLWSGLSSPVADKVEWKWNCNDYQTIEVEVRHAFYPKLHLHDIPAIDPLRRRHQQTCESSWYAKAPVITKDKQPHLLIPFIFLNSQDHLKETFQRSHLRTYTPCHEQVMRFRVPQARTSSSSHTKSIEIAHYSQVIIESTPRRMLPYMCPTKYGSPGSNLFNQTDSYFPTHAAAQARVRVVQFSVNAWN